MRGVDEPHWVWEKRPAFDTKDGRRVYPIHTGTDGSLGQVWVYDTDVDPRNPDLDYSVTKDHRVALLTYSRGRVVYVGTGRNSLRVGEAPWEGQGIASEMFRLAQEESPGLRHAHCRDRVTQAGEDFVRRTSPEEACRNKCGEGCKQRGPKPSVRPPSVRERIGRLFRR